MKNPLDTLEKDENHSSENEGGGTAENNTSEEQRQLEEQNKERDDDGYDDNHHHGEVDLTNSKTPTLDALTGTGVCAPTHEDSSRPRSPRMLERFEAFGGYLPHEETEEGYEDENEEASEELDDDDFGHSSEKQEDAYQFISEDEFS